MDRPRLWIRGDDVMRWIFFAAVFSAAALAAAAAAQSAAPAVTDSTPSSLTADDTPTIKVQSSLVEVSAVVRDAAGAPVSGLKQADFELKQDGKAQPINFFSAGADMPLTLALLVDTSPSQYSYIRDEINAGKAFFPAMMTRPDDRAVLVQFDNHKLLLTQLTSNKTTLEHALAYLTQPHDQIGPAGRGGTLLYDTIIGVSHLESGTTLGRRAMVVLTDGGDMGSHYDKKAAIREAQRAGVMVYTIYYSNGGGDEDGLKQISKATGGKEFAVDQKKTLAQIYAEIAADLRQCYELGYTPPDTRPDRYHKIDLRTLQKGLTVQAREGYYTPKQ
jgi:VWFA-related protein